MKSVLLSTRPKWCEKICHEIGKDENGKPIYEKRIEVRKTAPKEVPFKVFIYATRPKKFYKCGAVSTSDELLWLANGKVEMGDGFKFWADGDEYQCLNGRIIGEFVCEWITEINPHCDIDGCVNQYIHSYPAILGDDCLSFKEMKAYLGNKKGYDWHISNLKIYDNPRELSEFSRPCSYSGLCFSCKRTSFKKDGNLLCNTKITRPPQSWMYVKI